MSLKQKLLDEISALERDLIAALPGHHHAAVRTAVNQLSERTALHLGEPIVPQSAAQTAPTDKTEPNAPPALPTI